MWDGATPKRWLSKGLWYSPIQRGCAIYFSGAIFLLFDRSFLSTCQPGHRQPSHFPRPTLSFTGIESLLSLRTHQSWWSSPMGGKFLGLFDVKVVKIDREKVLGYQGGCQKKAPTYKFDEISGNFSNFSQNLSGPNFLCILKTEQIGTFHLWWWWRQQLFSTAKGVMIWEATKDLYHPCHNVLGHKTFTA